MKTMFLGLFGTFALILWSQDQLSQELAESRSARLSEIVYQLDFVFAEDSQNYQGFATLNFIDSQPEKDLLIDLWVQTVSAVKVDQKSIEDFDYRPENGRLIIPASHLSAGENQLTVEYQAIFSSNGSGFHRFVDPEDGGEYHYTDLQPYRAHHVFPCFDQPDLRGRFEVRATMPKTWTAMANGAVMSNRYKEKGRELTFRPTKPIPTYLFNLTIGDFAEWQASQTSIPMRLLCRQSQEPFLDAEGIFTVTEKGLAFFADYFDQPYPFEKYDQAFVPEYNAGAMENVGAVILNESLNFGFRMPKSLLTLRDSVILHEVAHHWFGNLVNLKWWDGLWLNESFASYMELLGLAALNYQDPWQDVLAGKSRVYTSDSLSTTHPIVIPVKNTKEAEANFDDITYTKGMAVLRQLDFSLGDDVFRNALRDYFRNHAWKATTVDDFLAAMQRHAPGDLSGWTQSWLYQAGVNQAELRWQADAGRIVKAEMHQKPGSGAALLRKHATQIGLFKADSEQGVVLHKTLRVDYQGAITPIPQLIGMEAPAFILPNWGEFDYVVSILDAQSLGWLLQNLPQIEDHLIRKQVWHLLWPLVQSGELSVANYLNLLMLDMKTHQKGEDLRLTVEYVLETMASFLPSNNKSQAARSPFFDFAKTFLEADKGSFQVRYLMFILMRESAHLDSELDFLFDYLNGDASLKGWELDDEDKLTLLETLMGHQFRRAQPLFENFAKSSAEPDPQVLKTLASCPLPETKQRAWQWIFGDSEVSLEGKRTLMDDFFKPGQEKLTKPYIAQYFQEIERVYNSGAWPLPRDLANQMFPYSGRKDTIKAAKRFLARPNLAPVLRNLIQTELERLQLSEKVRKMNRKRAAVTGR